MKILLLILAVVMISFSCSEKKIEFNYSLDFSDVVKTYSLTEVDSVNVYMNGFPRVKELRGDTIFTIAPVDSDPRLDFVVYGKGEYLGQKRNLLVNLIDATNKQRVDTIYGFDADISNCPSLWYEKRSYGSHGKIGMKTIKYYDEKGKMFLYFDKRFDYNVKGLLEKVEGYREDRRNSSIKPLRFEELHQSIYDTQGRISKMDIRIKSMVSSDVYTHSVDFTHNNEYVGIVVTDFNNMNKLINFIPTKEFDPHFSIFTPENPVEMRMHKLPDAKNLLDFSSLSFTAEGKDYGKVNIEYKKRWDYEVGKNFLLSQPIVGYYTSGKKKAEVLYYQGVPVAVMTFLPKKSFMCITESEEFYVDEDLDGRFDKPFQNDGFDEMLKRAMDLEAKVHPEVKEGVDAFKRRHNMPVLE